MPVGGSARTCPGSPRSAHPGGSALRRGDGSSMTGTGAAGMQGNKSSGLNHACSKSWGSAGSLARVMRD